MGKSWSLDKSFAEKHAIVSKKARILGISESDAYRLCVIEYETGEVQNKTTLQSKNAYNRYMIEAPRPGTQEAIKLKNEMMLELAKSLREAKKAEKELERAAKSSVKTRIDAKHGVGTYAKITEPEKDEGYDWWGWLPKSGAMKLPSLNLELPSFGLPLKAILTVLMLFIGVIVLLIAIGHSGMGGSVGRVAESEHKRKRG